MESDKASDEVKAACKEWLDTFSCGATNGTATDNLVKALEGCDCEVCKDIVNNKDFLAKKSQWIFGGDGWAYDIGFGGVDHVLASGKDINIMVFDTEVYSNTGGQSSKATKTGAVAQFAAGGKDTKKKDLAGIAMSYGYVYVAQIAMGADYNQTVKAIARGRGISGTVTDHCLCSMYQPWYQERYEQGSDRGTAGCRMRILEQLPLQPGCRGGEIHSGQQRAKAGRISGLPERRSSLQFTCKIQSGEGKSNVCKERGRSKRKICISEKLVTLYGTEE